MIKYVVVLFSFLALAACTQQESGQQQGGSGGQDSNGGGDGQSAASLAGYYVYSDPARGTFSLALLKQNRFLLVTESGSGLPRGSVGWYAMRGDRLHLSSEAFDAQGTVSGDILRLQFGAQQTPPDSPDAAPAEGLPFQRWDQPPEKSGGKDSEGQGTGGQKKNGGQGSGSSGQ